MKSTILIIAHNEEKHIDECLKSISNQLKKPEEIILVAHNCTDQTVKIAKKYSQVKVLEYSGPSGAVFSREYGLDISKEKLLFAQMEIQ
ncbi:MAG: glycosyltransferase family A protein [Candidatus Paceibacterota bacterium]